MVGRLLLRTLPFDSIKEAHPIDHLCPHARGDVPDPPAEANDAAHALQNDTPLCVRPDHLYLGDHNQNMQDMRRSAVADVTISRRHDARWS